MHKVPQIVFWNIMHKDFLRNLMYEVPALLQQIFNAGKVPFIHTKKFYQFVTICVI